MKTLRASVGILLAATGLAMAQQPADPPAGPGANAALVLRTADELDLLVGPIALYPDALIAIILPASTSPADVVLAARYTRDFPNDNSQVEHRAWDESVKSLTNYPEVLQWMDQNLQWTKQLGEAFIAQPADVMQSVQRLRAKARAVGTLVDTPQQQVIADQQAIRIVPAQPDVIYVPRYEPEVVFVDRPVYYAQPYITFGVGVPMGSWLAFDCDWYRSTIWVGNRHRQWRGHDWRRPVVPIAPPTTVVRATAAVRPWHPAPQPPRPVFSAAYSQRVDVARPAPLGSAPHQGYGSRHANTYANPPPLPGGPLPVVSPLPHTYTPAARTSEYAGPRAATAPTNVPQPIPALRTQGPISAPAATVTAAPTVTNRPAPNQGWVRERDRSYTPRNQAALPTAPSLPMAAPAQPAATVAPAAPAYSGRVYSHQPQAVPSLPMAAPAARPPATGPVAPAAAPVQSAPAPQAAQPAPTQRGESDRHSRRTENQQER